MSCSCGCCDGSPAHGLVDTDNAPGQPALRYRAGVHGSFFDAMIAGLSDPSRPAVAALRTRTPADPSIALLDAGATMLDVLTFYQERIANEGYLRTATERRSLVELARLVGYRPRPGVAASAHLAFSVELGARLTIPAGSKAQTVPGQDELPQTFETSQPLEARAEWNQLPVRRTRPQLTPRPDPDGGRDAVVIWFKGTATALRKGDPLLIEVPGEETPRVYRVHAVEVEQLAERTRVRARPWVTMSIKRMASAIAEAFIAIGEALPVSHARERVLPELRNLAKAAEKAEERKVLAELTGTLKLVDHELGQVLPGATKFGPWIKRLSVVLSEAARLAATPSSAPARKREDFDVETAVNAAARASAGATSSNPRTAARVISARLGSGSRATGALGIIAATRPELRDVLPAMVANARVSRAPELRVHALRVRASVFGNTASPHFVGINTDKTPNFVPWTARDIRKAERPTILHLDARYDSVLPDSWVVVDTSAVAPPTGAEDPRPAHFPLLVTRAVDVESGGSRTAYGVTGPSTTVRIADDGAEEPAWIVFPEEVRRDPEGTDALEIIRRTSVLAGSEQLELAEAPVDEPPCGKTGPDVIELGELQLDLRPGRWVIVSGERTDTPGTSGVMVAELRLIADVTHDVSRDDGGRTLPGERMHTFVTLATPLDHCYRLATVVVWGNVVDATHGETKDEILGGGDGSQQQQRFTLRASPLTHTAAATADGAASTLRLRVNEVLWHEARSMADAAPTDHVYVTSTSDDAKTTITTGGRAARLPTGRDNVRAVYRTGIGRVANVGAGRISQLGSRPLGLKDVVNPLRASGGADPDSAEQIRRNAPLGLLSLDRLVSLRDYADFARAFAGIGKASAAKLSDGQREMVHVTIAGLDDVPILPSSDLFVNLQSAFSLLGDARQPVQLAVRELVLLVIAARVRVAENYSWKLVEPHVRAALLEAFGSERRDLGQPVASSEVIGTIARVPGVEFVDLDVFGGIPEVVPDVVAAGATPARHAISATEIAARIAARLGGTAAPDASCGWLPPFCPVAARLAGPDENGVIAPAQIAILDARVPQTLLLTEIP
jgi:hypothetical protein